MDHIFAPQGILSALRVPIIGSLGASSQHIMGYDPSRKAWVMGYRRVMGYPPCPNFGRAKKYGVPGIMGYQDLWVKGTSTVLYTYMMGASVRDDRCLGNVVLYSRSDGRALRPCAHDIY